ncbi:MAG TPA: hypothetical protein VFA89_23245 [Terriglobales bacterium]|nr:hypothetical protein [Terriglobales bacterium]
MDKLSGGVLRLLTPIGPRYVQLSFWQRVYTLWIFRHFHSLPQQVLSRRQQEFLQRLCADPSLITWSRDHLATDMPVIGTIEQRLPVASESDRVASRKSTERGTTAIDRWLDSHQQP